MATSTTRAQQIGIWIIAVVLTVGTLGSFIVLILANDNKSKDTVTSQADYAKQLADYTAKQKVAAEANAANSIALTGYSAEPFDAASVTALQKDIIVAGTGDEVKSTDSINASYFGWTSDGKIFDSSTKKDTNKDTPVTFSLSLVIKGWTNGLAGQRVGSTIKLTIPADQAYGAQGSGTIPANAPLVFIVVINSIEITPAQ
ncbi:FKBP-type peptidyl-prolyl cis-trans isomerase [Candidatus Saccharibacteria bacterium]|nr:FKBP-type peptidyl-prolyl cis-trans isomerase [Candidatus Saccharibacteria bacterium]